MRYLLLLFVAGCSTAPAFTVEDRAGLGAYLAFEVVTHDASPPPGPSPSPAPKPTGDACPECDGQGRLGDGTVFVKCNACNGTGKASGAEPSIEEVSSGPDWNFQGDWNPTLSEMRQHLEASHDVDASKMTAAECRALHSLLHNAETRSESSSNCPSGACPTSGSKSTTTQRRGLFGRWR